MKRLTFREYLIQEFLPSIYPSGLDMEYYADMWIRDLSCRCDECCNNCRDGECILDETPEVIKEYEKFIKES